MYVKATNVDKTWGVPKIRGTILGVLIIRIVVYWGLYWGSPTLGNYHLPVFMAAHMHADKTCPHLGRHATSAQRKLACCEHEFQGRDAVSYLLFWVEGIDTP